MNRFTSVPDSVRFMRREWAEGLDDRAVCDD